MLEWEVVLAPTTLDNRPGYTECFSGLAGPLMPVGEQSAGSGRGWVPVGSRASAALGFAGPQSDGGGGQF